MDPFPIPKHSSNCWIIANSDEGQHSKCHSYNFLLHSMAAKGGWVRRLSRQMDPRCLIAVYSFQARASGSLWKMLWWLTPWTTVWPPQERYLCLQTLVFCVSGGTICPLSCLSLFLLRWDRLDEKASWYEDCKACRTAATICTALTLPWPPLTLTGCSERWESSGFSPKNPYISACVRSGLPGSSNAFFGLRKWREGQRRPPAPRAAHDEPGAFLGTYSHVWILSMKASQHHPFHRRAACKEMEGGSIGLVKRGGGIDIRNFSAIFSLSPIFPHEPEIIIWMFHKRTQVFFLFLCSFFFCGFAKFRQIPKISTKFGNSGFVLCFFLISAGNNFRLRRISLRGLDFTWDQTFCQFFFGGCVFAMEVGGSFLSISTGKKGMNDVTISAYWNPARPWHASFSWTSSIPWPRHARVTSCSLEPLRSGYYLRALCTFEPFESVAPIHSIHCNLSFWEILASCFELWDWDS